MERYKNNYHQSIMNIRYLNHHKDSIGKTKIKINGQSQYRCVVGTMQRRAHGIFFFIGGGGGYTKIIS